MFKQIVSLASALLLLAVFGDAKPTPTGGDSKQCPGGYANGAQVNIGRYWYECKDGLMVPKGCLTDDKRRVEIDETYDTDVYRMKCVIGPDGFLTITYEDCVHSGHVHKVGEQWQEEQSWHICEEVDGKPRVRLGGCVDQGRRVKLQEKVSKGDFIHQCNQSADGKPTMMVAGCVDGERKYAFGDKFDDPSGKVWRVCTQEGVKITGCLRDGERMQDGDRYFEDDVVLVCKVNGDATGFVPNACIQKEESGSHVERRVGCFWVEGKAPYMYEMTCAYDKARNTMAKKMTRCVYKEAQGTFKVNPGCYQPADQTGVGCVRVSGKDALKIQTFPLSKAGSSGLQQC